MEIEVNPLLTRAKLIETPAKLKNAKQYEYHEQGRGDNRARCKPEEMKDSEINEDKK